LNPSSTAGIVAGTIATSAVIAGIIAYLFYRYKRKQKARTRVRNNAMYFKPELSGESKKEKVELPGNLEIVELETNERWQELDGAM